MYANRRIFFFEFFVCLRKSGRSLEEHDDDVRFRREVEIWLFRPCAIKICNVTLNYGRIAEIFASHRKSWSRNTMVTSVLRAEVEMRPFRACAMTPAIIIGTVRSLWTWLWGRYHVPQNVFIVISKFVLCVLCIRR